MPESGAGRNHPLAWLVVLAGTDKGGQDRPICLLDLQEQRIGLVTAEHQDDPAPGADADDLAGQVGELVLLQQEPASAGT